MADLWIGNIETGTSDQEIKEFLTRYGFPALRRYQAYSRRGFTTRGGGELRRSGSGNAPSSAAQGAQYVLERTKNNRAGHEGLLRVK